MEKGLQFFKYTDLDYILKKYHWYDLPADCRKCIVCKKKLTKENFGGLIPGSVNGVCNDFSCIMAILLKEKKEILVEGYR